MYLVVRKMRDEPFALFKDLDQAEMAASLMGKYPDEDGILDAFYVILMDVEENFEAWARVFLDEQLGPE